MLRFLGCDNVQSGYKSTLFRRSLVYSTLKRVVQSPTTPWCSCTTPHDATHHAGWCKRYGFRTVFRKYPAWVSAGTSTSL